MNSRRYRDVRASAIPGGSEEILLDFAMRQVMAADCATNVIAIVAASVLL